MIRDIISFTLSNKKFAVDLQKTPLILSASKYLQKDFRINHSKHYFQFEDMKVEIINLHSYLNLKFTNLTVKTKILVGYENDYVFGLLVDEVNEVINLTTEYEKLSLFNNNDGNNIISGEIMVSDENLKIVEIDMLLKEINKTIMDRI